jgi:hypothetical protein
MRKEGHATTIIGPNRNNAMKEIVKAILVLFLTGAAVAAQPLMRSEYYASVPEPVWSLLKWPSTELITAKEKSVAASNQTKYAAQDASRWVRMAIDPMWLPAELHPLCLNGEFGGMDVIRYRWATNSRSFMVAQTGCIFVMEIRPETEKLSTMAGPPDLAAVRKICGEVFPKSGERPTGQLKMVPMPDFNKKILDWSFNADTTQEITNRLRLLIGWPRYHPDEVQAELKKVSGTNEAEVQAIIKRIDSQDNSDWYKSRFAWDFWFRNIRWFADQDRIVVFFLKDENGSVPCDFGPVRRGWF